jgi:hypothetical protein
MTERVHLIAIHVGDRPIGADTHVSTNQLGADGRPGLQTARHGAYIRRRTRATGLNRIETHCVKSWRKLL